MKQITTFFVSFVLVCLTAAFASAQGIPTVDIHGPGQRLVNITLLPPKGLDGQPVPGEAAKAFAELVANDLAYIPFLKLVPTSALLGGDPSHGVTGQDIDFKPFQLARVDLCLTTGWNGQYLEARVYETFSGRRVVGKAYRDVADKLPLVADRFCSAFLEALTGKKG
ncbi:MAG TPA: protein tolB, partial [Pseudodesulfovibrio sp.]|nr:protein tolB [Pseudodesulfovibrio sp.]